MSDMQVDIFAEMPWGQEALKRMREEQELPERFRLFEAGWMEDHPDKFENFVIKGAEFRNAKTGPNAGKLCIKVEGSERICVLRKSEIRKLDHNHKVEL